LQVQIDQLREELNQNKRDSQQALEAKERRMRELEEEKLKMPKARSAKLKVNFHNMSRARSFRSSGAKPSSGSFAKVSFLTSSFQPNPASPSRPTQGGAQPKQKRLPAGSGGKRAKNEGT